MKRTKKCPKCSSSEVVQARSGESGIDTIVAPLSDRAQSSDLGADLVEPPSSKSQGLVSILELFVCCACGYSEKWVPDRDLSKVRQAYLTSRTKTNT